GRSFLSADAPTATLSVRLIFRATYAQDRRAPYRAALPPELSSDATFQSSSSCMHTSSSCLTSSDRLTKRSAALASQHSRAQCRQSLRLRQDACFFQAFC